MGGGSKSWQSDGTTLPGLVFMVGKCVELEEIRFKHGVNQGRSYSRPVAGGGVGSVAPPARH